MDDPEPLQVGMTLEAVRQLWPGCRCRPVGAILSSDRTHNYQTVDFVLNDQVLLRATFDNGRLLYWGKPAPPEERA